MLFRLLLIASIGLSLLTASAPLYAQGAVKEADQLDFAQGLLSRGMYDMAISQYRKFIAEYPASPSLQEAYLSLAEGYFLSHDFDKASDAFRQFKQLYPNSDRLPVSLLRLAEIDIQQKKYDEALKELTAIDAQKQLKGPMLQSFDFYTAQAYEGKADNVSALDYFQKASVVDGASAYTAYAFKEIGKIQAQNGKYDEATGNYAKAIPLAADDPLKGELIYRTAEAQFLAGKYADAIKGFGQILDQYPGLDLAQNALANLLLAYYNLGQYDQVLAQYQKNAGKIKEDETYFPIHFAAVQAYIDLKEYDQANALLDKMLSFPSLKFTLKAKILVKRADILIREKKFREGLALLEANSSDNTENADENFFLKGQGYYAIGDYDHAFNFFENVYLNFPDSRFFKAALLGEAHARKAAGRCKEAAVLFLKYYNIQDDPALKSEALYDAAVMSFQSADTAGGINAAQEYIKTFPSGAQYGDVLLLLAESLGKNNRHQEAVSLLQGFLSKPETVQKPNTAYFLLGLNQQALANNDQALAAYAQVDAGKEEGHFFAAALKNTAIIDLDQKKEDQARMAFDRLISQADQNDLQIKTYIWICNEYLKMSKFDDVLRVAALAEKKFTPADLMEIEYFKAEALRGKDSCDEALKSYALVTAVATKDLYTGSAHIGTGLCLAKASKYEEARQEFKKALDENADDYTVTVHARFETANVDETQGNFEDALKGYLLIATIYDDEHYCSESLLRAGAISEKLQRKADALKMYSEILEKYKNSPAALQAKEKAGLLK